MNRTKLISAKSIIEDEISQYEDELSYLRAAKKNLETLIDKEQYQAAVKIDTAPEGLALDAASVK